MTHTLPGRDVAITPALVPTDEWDADAQEALVQEALIQEAGDRDATGHRVQDTPAGLDRTSHLEWNLAEISIPVTFTLDLAQDAPGALLAALQGFADHTSDPDRGDAALLALEVVRARMRHPVTLHRVLQPILDPIGIHPVTITITPAPGGGLEVGFDTSDECRRAATCLTRLGYTLTPSPRHDGDEPTSMIVDFG